MKLSGSILVLVLALNAGSAIAAAKSAEVDYTRQPRLLAITASPASRFAPAGRRSISAPSVRSAAAEARAFRFVEKYQRHLGSANAVHIGRTPSLDRSGTARLNRFVFRRSKPADAPAPARAIRAGGDLSASR